MRQKRCFRTIAAELVDLNAAREAAVLAAFASLEDEIPALASMALQNIGERSRAARWMSMHQNAFGGRSAYDLLADGDIDTVWDRISGECETSGAPGK